MASLWQRFRAIFGAKVSKALDRAENPSETLDYSYEQQLTLLQNVKRGIADVVTAKKRLQMQQTTLEQSVVKLETKSGVQQQLQGLDGQVQQLADQQEKLVANEGELSARIESFRSQKEVMKAQYSAAEAQVRIGEASTGIGGKMADAGAAIERARAKTEEMQARAGAMDELIASGTLEDFTSDKTQLDRELAQMSSQSQVDSDLERLKAEVGKGDEQKQLAGGAEGTQTESTPAEEKQT